MKVLVLLGVFSCTLARPGDPYHPPIHYPQYEDTVPKYEYGYEVKDDYAGLDFGHREARDGDYTQGRYYVQLPDGRMQKVQYSVDKELGYVAEVLYEGVAEYPDYQPASTYHGSVVYDKPAAKHAYTHQGLPAYATPVFRKPGSNPYAPAHPQLPAYSPPAKKEGSGKSILPVAPQRDLSRVPHYGAKSASYVIPTYN